MLPPKLMLQIIYPDGSVFQMPAGGALEIELEEMLAEKLLTKEIGFFRRSSQVQAMFRETFREVMYEFKSKVAHPNGR